MFEWGGIKKNLEYWDECYPTQVPTCFTLDIPLSVTFCFFVFFKMTTKELLSCKIPLSKRLQRNKTLSSKLTWNTLNF